MMKHPITNSSTPQCQPLTCLRRLESQPAILTLLLKTFLDWYHEKFIGYIVTQEDGQIVQVQSGIANLLQVEPSRLLNDSLRHWIVPEDQENYSRHCQAVFNTRSLQPQTHVIRFKRGDTHIKAQLESVSFREDSNAIRYVLTFISESGHQSEWKRLHDQLDQCTKQLNQVTLQLQERTQELQAAQDNLSRAQRLKDEFLINMNHELRTPLSIILGNAEILQEQHYGPLTSKQQKSVARIETSGRHLLNLVVDILDFSQIKAGQLQLYREPVKIHAVCQESLAEVSDLAKSKSICIHSQFDRAVLVLNVDKWRLKQILVNLLANAIKFTEEEGTVGFLVKGNDKLNRVELVVTDTGTGIPKEDFSLLFEPFVQLDGRLSRRYEGIGLGLALSLKLVEMHGGSISVTSKIGRGSCFTVILPWRTAENMAFPDSEANPTTFQ